MKSCSTCLHHSPEANGQMVCRFNPPLPFPMPTRPNALGQVGISVGSAFPPVSPDMWCSKHVEMKAFDMAANSDMKPAGKSSLILNGR